MRLAIIEHVLRDTGFRVRGGFHVRPEDAVPLLPGSRPARTLVLVGSVGDSLWRPFEQARRASGGQLTLDGWSQQLLSDIASDVDAYPLFPFCGPPYLPFQRWAQRAEPVFPSPIGPLIHPQYGLWHAYRGALAFAERLDVPVRVPHPSPCDNCAARPCLTTCPVSALTPGCYDVDRCVEHIGGDAGTECLQGGCLARCACPIGRGYQYPPAQARFHMEAFIRRNR